MQRLLQPTASDRSVSPQELKPFHVAAEKVDELMSVFFFFCLYSDGTVESDRK